MGVVSRFRNDALLLYYGPSGVGQWPTQEPLFRQCCRGSGRARSPVERVESVMTGGLTTGLRAFLTAFVVALMGVAVSGESAAAQTIVSAANQVFAVGDPSTTASNITITDALVPVIRANRDIRIHIPATFNMVFDASVTTVTITGSGAGNVSTTLSAYEDGGRTAVLNVTTNFLSLQQIVVSGLKFTTFSGTSASSNLWVELANNGAVSATDTRTIQIVAPTITSAANQTFTVGDAAVAISAVTITDAAAPVIKAANDIRIRIPATFNMTWNTSLTTATITGSGASKMSTAVTYEDAGKTLVLNVTTNFAASDQINVSGLQFNNFTAVSASAALQLVISGSGGGTAATDTRTLQIYSPMTISSAANQTFVAGNAATAMSAITITEDGSPSITATNKLRIRIPAGFNMTWNTGIGTATLGGSAAGKVQTTATYENGGQVLFLNVVSSFVAGDVLTISGLQFNNFSGASPANNLQLVVSGSAGGATAATDDKTKTIFGPSLSSAANQTFVVADPATNMSAVTVNEAATAATITAANDIRIRVPTGFNMTWNTALTTATVSGSAAGKVSTAVTYENAGQVLLLNVTANFVAGDQVVVSGLQFTSFSAVSAANNLQLVISGAAGGGTAATDARTITIVAPSYSEPANQVFTVGDASTAMSVATITDAATAVITATKDIRLRIPAGVNMTWNTSLTTATIGGAAASKVSTTVTYENAGKTLVLNVTSDFAAGDQITVSGLEFNNFTVVSAASALQLVVSGSGGGTASSSNRTKQIFAPLAISSAASQMFNIGMGAHTVSTITVRGDATTQINATNDIRIRIPAALNMTWNTAVTTATIGGAAAAKVSTTVSYENAGKTLVLNVTTSFAPGDQITVGSVQYNNFTALSSASSLELVTGGAGGATAATDDKTISIVAAYGITSAADQTFYVGQSSIGMSAMTITDSATIPGITAGNNIRLRIPAGLNMTWNTGIATGTFSGSAAAKVSTSLAYENGGQILFINVLSNFVAGDQLIVSGAQFNNFTALSAANSLELVVSGAPAGPTIATDDKTKRIVSYNVGVSPALTTASGLPSNGTNYTVLYTVQNSGTTSDSYDLLTTRTPGTAVTTVSITGTGVTQGSNPDSARLTNLGSGASIQVTVTYSIGNVAGGTLDTLTMKARSLGDPSKAVNGRLDVTVIRPSMSVSRGLTPSGTQPPGTELTHTISITNSGTASAASLVLADSLGTNSDFKLGSVQTNLPGGITVALEYSNDGGASWTYAPVSAGCGAPPSFDGCVNRIRWRLLSSLSAVPPNNTGNVQFVSRIR